MWEIKYASFHDEKDELVILLKDDWEPFSVTYEPISDSVGAPMCYYQNIIWLRKRVKDEPE